MNKSKNRSGMLIFEKRRKKLVYLRLTSLLHESDESDLVSASFELTARCVVFVATDFLQPDFWRSCPESDEEISALPEHWKLKLKKARWFGITRSSQVHKFRVRMQMKTLKPKLDLVRDNLLIRVLMEQLCDWSWMFWPLLRWIIYWN